MAETNETSELIEDIREQVVYMKELGVDWLQAALDEFRSRDHTFDGPCLVAGLRDEVPSGRAQAPEISNLRSEISDGRNEVPERPAGSRLAELPSLTKRKSPAFFDKYNPGDERQATREEGREEPLTETPPILPEPTETVEQIRAEIGPDCVRCPLGTMGRRQVVNSVGNFDADLMFVGEAPGGDEDIQGEPFVGRAGQLLTDIIEKGLLMRRSDVFIGNINRCRPPGNRTPLPEEAVVCKPFLLREIAVVRPRVIVVLGAHAAQTLLETKTPISKMRGHFHDLNGVKVMPTFHPAYLLRDPNKKREVWEDIKMVRDYLNTGTTN
jgi:uracil-DNA glycosylase family 4